MTTEVSTTAIATAPAKCAGRDLGMAALGQNFGSALGPLLAGLVVAVLSRVHGYVWPVALVVVLLPAITIPLFKAVR